MMTEDREEKKKKKDTVCFVHAVRLGAELSLASTLLKRKHLIAIFFRD
jgi:hypothetical protein